MSTGLDRCAQPLGLAVPVFVCLFVCLFVADSGADPAALGAARAQVNATLQQATSSMQRNNRAQRQIQRTTCHVQHAPCHVHVAIAVTRGKVRSGHACLSRSRHQRICIRCQQWYSGGATDATTSIPTVGAVPCILPVRCDLTSNRTSKQLVQVGHARARRRRAPLGGPPHAPLQQGRCHALASPCRLPVLQYGVVRLGGTAIECHRLPTAVTDAQRSQPDSETYRLCY